MYLSEEIREEYSWNYGRYHEECYQQLCVQVLSFVWILLHERMTIMKSWFSNLFHSSNSVVPSTSSETTRTTLNFTKPSQPVVNSAMDYYLAPTRHFNSNSTQHLAQHPTVKHCGYSSLKFYQDKKSFPDSTCVVNSSTVTQDLTTKQASRLTLCATNTLGFQNLFWFSDSMALLANSLSDTCNRLPVDYQYSCSAPSVLCAKEFQNKKAAGKPGSSVGDSICHRKSSEIRDLHKNCKPDRTVEHFPLNVKRPDSPMHSTRGIDTSAKSNFASCSNPIIAYILGLNENSDCSDESDGDFDECISEENDPNYWISQKDDIWDCSSSESTEKTLTFFNTFCQSSGNESDSSPNSGSCDSEIIAVETVEENPSFLSSSFSDYWSDDSDFTDFPDLQKPYCTNSHINYILNIEDDSEIDKGDHQTKGNTCTDEIWEEISKSDDEFSFCFGSKLFGTASELCKPSIHQNSRKQRSLCKVRFDESPPTIHHMIAWSFAYKHSRCGPWESYARDRERFCNRIKEVESAISWCFSSEHREAVWKNRIV